MCFLYVALSSNKKPFVSVGKKMKMAAKPSVSTLLLYSTSKDALMGSRSKMVESKQTSTLLLTAEKIFYSQSMLRFRSLNTVLEVREKLLVYDLQK